MKAALKDQMSFLSLSGALFALSAFGISLFFEGYHDLHYAPAILALLVFACIGIIPSFWRGLHIPAVPASILIFTLWFYVTLSLAWSSVPFVSLVTYLVFAAGPLAFFTPLLAPEPEKWLKPSCILFFAALCILAGWAIIQYVFFQDLFGVRAHHPLPNPNNMAGLLNLGLIPALAFLLGTKDRGKKYCALLLLSFLFIGGLIATESRGGLLSALISFAVLAFILRKNPPSIGLRLLGIALGIGIIYHMVAFFGGYDLAPRLISLFNITGDETAMARLSLWQTSWRMFLDYLPLGTGLGTFYLYYPSYRLPGADNSTGNWAHMDPLQYGVEMGFLAPLLFYAICFAVLVRTIKALNAAPQNSQERVMIAALFCALLAMVIHTHITFHLYVMPILIVTGLWLAAWYHITARVLNDNAYRPAGLSHWQRPFMGVVTLFIAALLGVMAVSSALGQHHLLRAHQLIRQGLTEQFVAAIGEAETWAPRSFIDPEVKLAAFYIDLLGPNAAALFTTAEQQSLYGETLDLLDSAGQMNPAWAEIDYQRGLLYAIVNPDFEPDIRQKAVESLQSAVRKDPRHFQARLLLARLYIKRGMVEDAYQILQQGLAYPHPLEVEQNYRPLLTDLERLVIIKRNYESQSETTSNQPTEENP